jgi:hypothetical protein
VNETEIVRAISKKWLSASSLSYFNFILAIANKNFNIKVDSLSDIERQMAVMLYYDIWQNAKAFPTLQEAIQQIGVNQILVDEIKELLTLLTDRIDFIEKPIDLPFTQPLFMHSRYTREQTLAAFGLSTFENKSSNREGVAQINDKNVELLFITLNKAEADYSPTTLYQDYAINDYIFHWQSQNSARPEHGKGKTYIEQAENGKKVLLFVREQNDDEYGNTMGYVFLGDANYLEHEGAKPMNIKWELNEPMPAYIWRDTAKMAVG